MGSFHAQKKVDFAIIWLQLNLAKKWSCMTELI